MDLNGRKRDAKATFTKDFNSTFILHLLHLWSKDVESIAGSMLLTIHILVDVPLVHDHQERVFIALDSFEQQAEGLMVADVAGQDTPEVQKFITRRQISEAQLNGQAPCAFIT